MKCPKCGAQINISPLKKEWCSRGGQKSRRVLTSEDARKMVEAREAKKILKQKENYMNLYLISQETHNDYDTYDSAVVAAKDEEMARNMNPSNGKQMTAEEWTKSYSSWCYSPNDVKVELIGKAVKGTEEGVICASFNAG